ncbi:Zinc knuckle family protein, partial [Aphelenchoides avenae]
MDLPKVGGKTPNRPCIFCGGAHFDSYCSLAATLEQRLQLASQRGITCIRCFAGNHTADECLSTFRGCVYCRAQEHNVAFCQKAIDNQNMWWRKRACAFCDGPHMDIDCTQYATASERTLQAQHRGRCLGCLGSNHSVDACTVPRHKCVHCHHLGLLTASSDVSPYHNVTLCPVKFPNTEAVSNGVAGSGTQAAVIASGWCDGDGPSTSERTDNFELKKQLEDEKNKLSAERKGLEAVEHAVREREAAVKRREAEMAAEESSIAEERERLEKAKKHQATLEKYLIDREKKLHEEGPAGSSSTLAEDELQVEVIQDKNRKLRCELAQVTRERDTAVALSEERKADLDKAHNTLSEQFRKRRELRDVYYQMQAQRDRHKAENEALKLTLQFREGDSQRVGLNSPQTTSTKSVHIKQEVLDFSEMDAIF